MNEIKHPKQKGELTEQIIICEFMKRGISVSKPIGDNQPYDLIIDLEGKLLKVQSRTARFCIKKNDKSVILFNALSYRVNTKKCYIKDSRSKFDLFVIYFPHNEKVYVIDVKLIINNHGRLSLIDRDKVLLAKDYEIDKYLSRISLEI